MNDRDIKCQHEVGLVDLKGSSAEADTLSVSVLMAIYKGDDPQHFSEALDSIYPFINQLDGIVLVADGPLLPEQESIIAERKLILRIDLLRLPHSKGLGEALNVGLRHSKSDYILRMDSDDLSRPDRFLVLRQALLQDPQLDVIGSYIAEFIDDPSAPHAVRRVPIAHDDIRRKMKLWCAMNHVSCLIRRSALLEAGGYQGGPGFSEDWWLWCRLLKANARFANVDSILVDVRVGNGMFQRRRGVEKFKQDLRLIQMMYMINFVSFHHIIVLVSTRFLQRFLPVSVLGMLYAWARR